MSIQKAIKTALNAGLNPLGLEIHRKTPGGGKDRSSSIASALALIKRLGFSPAVVIDVGVADGTPALYAAFPDARHILIEPLIEFQPHLERLVRRLTNARYIPAAAVREPGPVTLNVYPDLVSSWVGASGDKSVAGVQTRVVSGVTLDGVCNEQHLSGPYLLKIDAEGKELDVLAGARKILPDTGYIILEAAFFEFNKGQSQFCDVIAFMKDAGFLPYDIFGFQYRPFDGALAHVDIAFVKDGGLFRAHGEYATDRQRQACNEEFQKRFGVLCCKSPTRGI